MWLGQGTHPQRARPAGGRWVDPVEGLLGMRKARPLLCREGREAVYALQERGARALGKGSGC